MEKPVKIKSLRENVIKVREKFKIKNRGEINKHIERINKKLIEESEKGISSITYEFKSCDEKNNYVELLVDAITKKYAEVGYETITEQTYQPIGSEYITTLTVSYSLNDEEAPFEKVDYANVWKK